MQSYFPSKKYDRDDDWWRVHWVKMKSCCGGNGRIGAAAHEIFCWQLKNRELILTSGPRTRTSEVRYSHVRAPNDPLPPPSCHFVSSRCGRWISQVFNQKMKRNMEICMTATAGIWLASGKSTLTQGSNVQLQFSCLQQRVGFRGHTAEWDAECIDTMTPLRARPQSEGEKQ